VELKIEPEPSPAERDAIIKTLSEEGLDGAGPPAYRSAWREDGIRENALDAGSGELADA
jgi:hypothetical protein